MTTSSPLTRGRELKLTSLFTFATGFASPLTRGRELKRLGYGRKDNVRSRPLRGGVN